MKRKRDKGMRGCFHACSSTGDEHHVSPISSVINARFCEPGWSFSNTTRLFKGRVTKTLNEQRRRTGKCLDRSISSGDASGRHFPWNSFRRLGGFRHRARRRLRPDRRSKTLYYRHPRAYRAHSQPIYGGAKIRPRFATLWKKSRGGPLCSSRPSERIASIVLNGVDIRVHLRNSGYSLSLTLNRAGRLFRF